MTKNKLTKILAVTLAGACAAAGAGCAAADKAEEFTVTIFSDVHHGDNNYNDFTCTRALEKLGLILDETPNSEFYINLGDMADYLKDGSTGFYDEVADFLHGHNLNIYHPEGKNYREGRRLIYNLMGNHETAFVPKSALRDYVPYVENVGSVYSFSHKGILFLALDANFDRETGSDACEIMRTSTKFVFPQAVIDWALEEAAAKRTADTKGIVWLSHIAFKDIENTSRFAIVNGLNELGLPLTIFEGHTHREMFDEWRDDDDNLLCTVYTLPAVTSGPTYKYYNVTFCDGRVKAIDKHADTIDEE